MSTLCPVTRSIASSDLTDVKQVNILSFDGGGSRGVMEVEILIDIMAMLTWIIRGPEVINKTLFSNALTCQELEAILEDNDIPKIQGMIPNPVDHKPVLELMKVNNTLAAVRFSKSYKTQNPERDQHQTTNAMRQKLDRVRNPEHPVDHFDMIVGTSTGALIAFALIGGDVDAEHGTRKRMSLNKIKQMYLDETKNIFSGRVDDPGFSNRMSKFIQWAKDKLNIMEDLNIMPYSQDGLVAALKRVFGETTLDELGSNGNDHTCVGAAVARQYNEDPKVPDILDIFDTESEISYQVVEVLKASAAAPTFFVTPCKIGRRNYVDGGIGGNCPVQQAIYRSKEVFGDDCDLTMVLSIAPPLQNQERLEDLPTWKHSLYWMKYFVHQVTDGFAVFHDTERSNKDSIFLRTAPQSEESRTFKMDELDVEAMIQVVRSESVADSTYMWKTLEFATFILLCSQKVTELKGEQNLLVYQLLDSLYQKERYKTGWKMAGAWLEKLKKTTGADYFKAIALYYMGRCATSLEQLSSAEKFLTESNELLHDHVFGKDIFSVDVGVVLTQLSLLQAKKGDFDVALSTVGKVIDCMRDPSSYGPDANNRHLAHALTMRGICYWCQGGLQKALDTLRSAEAMLLAAGKSDAIDIPWLMVFRRIKLVTGNCLVDLKKYKEGIAEFTATLKIFERTDAQMTPPCAMALNNLGYALMKVGDFDKAITAFEKSLNIYKHTTGEKTEGHSNILPLMHLGNCYREKGQYQEALQILQEARVLQNHIKGDHQSKIYTPYYMGLTHKHECKLDAARKRLQEAKNMAETCQGGKKFLAEFDIDSVLRELEG